MLSIVGFVRSKQSGSMPNCVLEIADSWCREVGTHASRAPFLQRCMVSNQLVETGIRGDFCVEDPVFCGSCAILQNFEVSRPHQTGDQKIIETRLYYKDGRSGRCFWLDNEDREKYWGGCGSSFGRTLSTLRGQEVVAPLYESVAPFTLVTCT